MNIDLQRYWGYQEMYFVGELSSKIIDSMQKNGKVTLISKEQRSARESGLFFLLDQLSHYHKWDKSKITIKTLNYLEQHDQYTIKFLCEEVMPWINRGFECAWKNVDHRTWNGDKTYGMFLGRANVTRIRGIHNHINFTFRSQGLVSWHHDLQNYVDPSVLNEYLCSTNQTYEELIGMTPFSDIGTLLQPPVVRADAGGVDWNTVYEKIAIELVFESSESASCSSFSEKLLRPMLFKRPFMLIGGANAIKNLKEVIIPNWLRRVDPTIDICFFENIIPNIYDVDHGICRVDHVFDILSELIRTHRIQSILDECQEQIEVNYESAKKFLGSEYAQANRPMPFDFESWKNPDFYNA